MPIINNPVNFHFINNTPPSTYDNDTIYFDSISGKIKVGNTTIAAINDRIDVSQYLTNNIVTLISQQKDQYQFYYGIQGFDIPLTYCGTNKAVFSAILPTDNNNIYPLDTSSIQLDPYTVIVTVNNNGNVTTEFTLLEKPTLTITISLPTNTIISSSGTVITNNTVKNNYNNYASSSTFWTELRNAASSGKNITIISTEEDEVMYKFNNYYYQIGSGDYLNFSLIINNNNLTEIYSVEFNMSNEIITLFNKNLTI